MQCSILSSGLHAMLMLFGLLVAKPSLPACATCTVQLHGSRSMGCSKRCDLTGQMNPVYSKCMCDTHVALTMSIHSHQFESKCTALLLPYYLQAVLGGQ